MLTINDDADPACPLRKGRIAQVRGDENALDHELDVLGFVFQRFLPEVLRQFGGEEEQGLESGAIADVSREVLPGQGWVGHLLEE